VVVEGDDVLCVVRCDCAVGSACCVAGSSWTGCSVAGAITGFALASVPELEKGHIVMVDVRLDLVDAIRRGLFW
jgi:hypothetical protein